MSDPLKIMGRSPEEVTILSGLLQDTTVRVGDIAWLAEEHRFAFVGNRFRWEKKRRFLRPKGERVRTGFHMNGILEAKLHGIDLSQKDEVLALLDIEAHENGDDFFILINFADGKGIRLKAECIEAMLSDLSDDWEALARPHHDA
ncbi:MAG: DUF2948 family protein [Alphaproteobacteria bacterium]|nr:DUF2948 family protein [Alphaproteobacteria bacterium]